MTLYRITYRDRFNKENDWPIIASSAREAIKWFDRLQPESYRITYCFPTV